MDLSASETHKVSLQKQIQELIESKKIDEEKKQSEISSLRQETERLQEDIETCKWQLETETNKKNQEIKVLRRSLVSTFREKAQRKGIAKTIY